ncbi:MAG TPA: hypothetical protein DCM05_02935 [Elusimicrobia bacterium]|nr:hypothetical protein [Elusimicrobiota bacterium]
MNVRSLDWKKGQKIVMAFSPGCGFSRQAFADIEGDASLVAAFRKHALLVAPPGEVVEWQSYSSWNKEHPGLKGYIGYSMSDWPELDLAGTPRFYFFSDGMLNVRYDGWREPIADRKAELVKGLQSIGLAPLSK